MTEILHQLIGNLVTPIIYQMFFRFKESQVVISCRILSPFAQKKPHLPLSGSRKTTWCDMKPWWFGNKKWFSSVMEILVTFLKTWWDLRVTWELGLHSRNLTNWYQEFPCLKRVKGVTFSKADPFGYPKTIDSKMTLETWLMLVFMEY